VDTNAKVQTNAKERARRVLVDTQAAGAGVASSLHGENHAAIMEEIIKDNPELQDISAMSEHRIVQDQMARKAANIKSARRSPGTQRKIGLVSKLFGWT
jgi:MinD-like ATPase involved in chromosome partitioning or flagellar assembly